MAKKFALIKRGISKSDAEAAAGVTPVNTAFPVLDIRRYGAVADYDPDVEVDGQVATNATDSRPAINDAIDVASELGGGVIRIRGGGDFYVANSIDAKGISNLYFYIEPGTTLRSTKYTNLGSLIVLGSNVVSGLGSPLIENIGVYGGGTLRTFQPDHATVPAHQVLHAYVVGDYVLSTDSNGEERAYYCKTAGTSGAASPPDAVSGSDTDGTVVWQDADNDNTISIQGFNIRVDGMDIPESSGKPITVQLPQWGDVWITRNRIGSTNDKGIEVKGNQAISGQEAAYGDGINILDNIIEWTGHEGIDVEQPSFSSVLNQNCRVIGNLVRSAGNTNDVSGIHINRCNRVEVRGNKVLESGGNGFHIRLCENVTGDLHSENAGAHGVHLQSNSGFSFDYIYVKDAATHGLAESSDVLGGRIGRLVVDGATNGYNESSRAGDAPVLGSYKFSNLSGVEFSGTAPNAPSGVPANAKLQSFTLQITNSAGTIQHRFIDDTVNAGASSFVDRITGASASLTNTPVGANASTAFAAGGKISSAQTEEFILNHANAAAVGHGVKVASIVQNDSDTDLIVGIVRRSVNVNGTTLSRWHLSFRQTSDGAAWAIAAGLASGETVSVQCVMYLP